MVKTVNNIHEKITWFWLAESSADKESHQCNMCNTSAKSVIPVQITNQNSWIWASVHRCQILECYKNFRKPPNTFENFPRVSEVFRALPNTSEDFQKFSKIFKNCQKIILRIFQHFWIFSEDFWRFPTISKDLTKNSKMLKNCFKHFVTISEFFWWFPKTSEDVWRFLKISKDFQKFCKLVGMLVFSLSGAFSQVFQRISKHSTKGTWTFTSGNWPTVKFFHVCY